MDEPAVNRLLDQVLAPWVKQLGLAAGHVDETEATLTLPFSEHLRHAGGVICGQVFMAAADTAMVVAISAALGGFQPMTTVSLEHQFSASGSNRRHADHGARAAPRSEPGLRRGQELFDSAGKLAAHATTTHALLKEPPANV